MRSCDGDALAAWLGLTRDRAARGESFARGRAPRGRGARRRHSPRTRGATVVVVSHVTPIKLLVQAALDAPPSALFRLFLDTASVSIVDYGGDGNRFAAAVQRHQPPVPAPDAPTVRTPSQSAAVASTSSNGTVIAPSAWNSAARPACRSAGSSRRHSRVASEPG